MTGNVDYKAIKKQERKVGRVASKMIESRITQQLRALGLIETHGLEESVKTKPIMGQLRLFRISTTMERHGFILQHGVNDKRTGHTRIQAKTKLHFTVREHTMILQRKSFIPEAVENSGAFEYLVDEIGKIRMQEVPIAFNGNTIEIK